MKKLPGLTVIRFFAAAWVFCFHSLLWVGHRGPVPDLSSVGYAGVSVFFVLSGFILSYNYLGTDFIAKEFWGARAARIVPVYWLALLLAVPGLVHDLRIGRASFSMGLFTVPLFLQSWIPSASLVWNAPAWSVSTEAFFYAIFPFVSRGLVRSFRKRPVLILLSLWFLSAAPTVLYAIFWPEGPVGLASTVFWLQVIRFNPLARVPEFLLGVCLGAGFLDGWRIPRPKLATLGCLLALYLIVVMLHEARFPSLHNGLCDPLFSLLILSIASADNWLNWAPLVLLGEASYSLYLLTFPVGSFYNGISKYVPLPSRSGLSGVTAYFAVCVACSLLVYTVFEKPCRRKVRNLISSKRLVGAKVV